MMDCETTGLSILHVTLNVTSVRSFECSGSAIDSWPANFSACWYIEISFSLSTAAIGSCPARQFIRGDFIEPGKLG
jgi:hypothetical protein